MMEEPRSEPRKRVADPNHPAYRVEGEGRLGDRETPAWLRGIGEFFGDLAVEALFAVLGIAFIAGLVAFFSFGWSQDHTLTAMVIIVVFAFLGYGAVHIATPEDRVARWPRIAAAAACCVCVAAVLAFYGLWYR